MAPLSIMDVGFLGAAGGGALSVGGWKEVARVTISGSTNNLIDITGIPDKHYYWYMGYCLDSGGNIEPRLRINGITTATYPYRNSFRGGADSPVTGQLGWDGQQSSTFKRWHVGYLANLSAKEKLMQEHTVLDGGLGAGNDPERGETGGKHTLTSGVINQLTWDAQGAGVFDIGSEGVVLGWDPADTHTDNFWEPIGNDTGTTLDATITAKKYIWAKMWVKSAEASSNFQLRVGNGSLDSGANYSSRSSINSGAENLNIDANEINANESLMDSGESAFLNILIINRSANEKLFIMHTVRNAAGLTAGTAPGRVEVVAKWITTGSQIDHIGTVVSAGSFDSASLVQAWGAD